MQLVLGCKILYCSKLNSSCETGMGNFLVLRQRQNPRAADWMQDRCPQEPRGEARDLCKKFSFWSRLKFSDFCIKVKSHFYEETYLCFLKWHFGVGSSRCPESQKGHPFNTPALRMPLSGVWPRWLMAGVLLVWVMETLLALMVPLSSFDISLRGCQFHAPGPSAQVCHPYSCLLVIASTGPLPGVLPFPSSSLARFLSDFKPPSCIKLSLLLIPLPPSSLISVAIMVMSVHFHPFGAQVWCGC